MKQKITQKHCLHIFSLLLCMLFWSPVIRAQESISQIEATSDDLLNLAVGKNCDHPSMTITKGSPVGFDASASQWYKREADGSYVAKGSSDKFEEGTYVYMARFSIGFAEKPEYELSDNVQLKVNGEEWTKSGSVYHSSQIDYVFFQSPKFVIEGTGIKGVSTDGKPAVRYNLKGHRVDENYKGVVIINGKKILVK